MTSLSSKYSKVPALEGTFSASQNMISFSIPAGAKYDLSDSTVLIDLQIQTTETNPANLPQYEGGNGVYRLGIGFTDDGANNTVVPTCAIVKHAHMDCRAVGQIESLQRCDTLNVALKQYTESTEEKEGNAYYGLCSKNGVGAFNLAPFAQIMKLGAVKSRNVSHSVRIPLKDIFNFCNTPVYDTNKYGETRLKLECNLDRLSVVQDLSRTGGDWDALNYEDIDSPATNVGATTVSSFVTTNTYINPDSASPWYVGMKINMEYIITPTGGGAAVPYNFAAGNARERIIESLSYDNQTGKVTININNGIATAASDAWSAVKFQAVDPATTSFVYNKVELELKQVNDATPSGIDYFTYQTEEDSGFSGTQTNINKQYTCDGITDNLLICLPDDILPKKEVTSIRIAINNVEETPEAVTTGSSLYYDRQNRFWFNMGGGDLKCLRDKCNSRVSAVQNNPSVTTLALGQPLPVTNENKQVQLDMIYSAGAVERIRLYKRMPKSL